MLRIYSAILPIMKSLWISSISIIEPNGLTSRSIGDFLRMVDVMGSFTEQNGIGSITLLKVDYLRFQGS